MSNAVTRSPDAPFSLRPSPILTAALFAVALAGCATTSPTRAEPAAPPVTPTLPPSFPPQDLVGRWGLAAYHVPSDRERTEAAALQRLQAALRHHAGPRAAA